LHDDLVVSRADCGCSQQLVLGAGGCHLEVVHESLGLDVDPLGKLVVGEAEEVVVAIEGGDEAVAPEAWSAAIAVDEVDGI
jgi:hypothetical protein